MKSLFFRPHFKRVTPCQNFAGRGYMPAFALLSAFLILSFASNAFAAAIYKSIDKDGNVIFTDQPLDGSESVNEEAKKAREAQSTDEANSAASNEARQSEDGETEGTDQPEGDVENEDLGATGVLIAPEPINPPKSDYKEPEEPTRFLPVNGVEILTPIHDATLIDPLEKIWVEFQSYPTPIHEAGLTAQLWMNDQIIASGKRPMLSLPAPRSGTHILQVKLVDDNGQLYLASENVHIHVKNRVAEQ